MRIRGSAPSHSQGWSRRLRDSFNTPVTQSCGPSSPASTAFCVIEQTFEVEWLCSAFSAATTSFGASVQPQRHPVIAYALDADPQITVRSRILEVSTFVRLCGTGS